MNADGAAADADAVLDQPVRRRGRWQARGLGGQALFLDSDPSAGPGQVLELHLLQEAEQGETGRRRLGHKFDSTHTPQSLDAKS